MRYEGYRYVRQYGGDFRRDSRKDKSSPAWALWQVIDGKKHRVGTAHDRYDMLAFLFLGPVPMQYLENRYAEYSRQNQQMGYYSPSAGDLAVAYLATFSDPVLATLTWANNQQKLLYNLTREEQIIKHQISIFQQRHLLSEVPEFPQTRYQGSKLKLLPWIWNHVSDLEFSSALDAFGGTGSVSFLLKGKQKQVTYNDILYANSIIAKALIENRSVTLWPQDFPDLTARRPDQVYDNFVQRTFKDIYFTEGENEWIDVAVQNIRLLENEYQKALAFFALFQACIVKRPYNLFHRANLYMRTSDVERNFGNKTTWDKPFDEHFHFFLTEASQAVFDNGLSCRAENNDVFDLSDNYEFVYIDTPYMNKNGLGPNYFDFYHFLEGLADYGNWESRLDRNKKHLPLKADRKCVWLDKNGVTKAFDDLFYKFRKSHLVVSYRNDGVPSAEELHTILKRHKGHIKAFAHKPYKYVLSSNGNSHEALLVAI